MMKKEDKSDVEEISIKHDKILAKVNVIHILVFNSIMKLTKEN